MNLDYWLQCHHYFQLMLLHQKGCVSVFTFSKTAEDFLGVCKLESTISQHVVTISCDVT